jgi:hypothetical protein
MFRAITTTCEDMMLVILTRRIYTSKIPSGNEKRF